MCVEDVSTSKEPHVLAHAACSRFFKRQIMARGGTVKAFSESEVLREEEGEYAWSSTLEAVDI